MQWSDWLNPPTTWRGASRRSLRRDSTVWLVWSLAWLGIWAALGYLIFRSGDLPDINVILLLLFFGSQFMWFVSGLFALIRFSVSFFLD
jgi:hypothetical protein